MVPRPMRRVSLNQWTGALVLALLLVAVCAMPAITAAVAVPHGVDARVDGGLVAATSPTPAPAEAITAGETPELPRPGGTAVAAGRWRYTLAPVLWGQRNEVLAANIAAPPQLAGYGWALVHVTVHNTGSVPAEAGRFELVLHASGWTVSNTAAQRRTLRMPDEFVPGTVEPGDARSGNFGFWIPDYASADPECKVELRTYARGASSPTSHWLKCAW